MKVVLACSAYPPDVKGGGEYSVQWLAEGLVRAGVQVIVFAVADENGEQTVNGVRVCRFRPHNLYWSYHANKQSSAKKLIWHLVDSWNVLMAATVSKFVQREQPSIFHSSTIEDVSPAAWRTANTLGVPVVHTLRSYSQMCPAGTMFRGGRNCGTQCCKCAALTLARRHLSKHVAGVVGISQAVLDVHARAGYFPFAQRAVIRNIYEVPHDVSVSARAPGRLFRVGFIGRLERIKGFDILLNALELATFDGPVELVVAGVGREAARVVGTSATTALKRIYLGHVAPHEFYPQVDVVVVPSLWEEPLGRVIFEAYAYGVPVVASRRGGIPEIVEDGATGVLFEPERPGELAKILHGLHSDRDTLRRMRARCLAKAQEFSSERIVDQHLEFYELLLNQKGRKASA